MACQHHMAVLSGRVNTHNKQPNQASKGNRSDKASLGMTAKRSLSQSLKGDCPKAKGAGLATSIVPSCLIPVYKLHG